MGFVVGCAIVHEVPMWLREILGWLAMVVLVKCMAVCQTANARIKGSFRNKFSVLRVCESANLRIAHSSIRLFVDLPNAHSFIDRP
jgi:hypothetical protein